MHTVKKFFALATMLSFVALQAVNDATPTLVLRSQGRHADRQKMVGVAQYTNAADQESNYSVADITVGYSRSFREDRLARCLFGKDLDCSCDPTIKVQGSNVVESGKVDERDAKAWLADYLYLNCDFDGEFSIKPRIQNVTVDLDLFVGLNDWMEGLSFRIYGPITWTKWRTNFCSTSDTDVTTSCQFGGTGYFTGDGSEVFLSKLSDYFIGKSPDPANGVTFQPLKYAKMGASCDVCDETQAGFADLRAELGYVLFNEEDYNLSINVQTAAPTGNRRRAEFVMNPVVGNGNHWELGGGLDFHYAFWKSEDSNRALDFYLDANVTHLFSGREQRTFDLKDKVNSRYMLASRFARGTGAATDLNGVSAAGGAAPATPASYVFDNAYAPVANLTTLNVRVDVGVQADIVAMLSYQCDNFNFDFGYNLWVRSCESIKCPKICDPCDQSLCSVNGENRWALKGDARMFGFDAGTDTARALSASQSGADIHGGTNINFESEDSGCTNVRLQNCGVDNPLFARNSATRLIHTPASEGGLDIDANQIKTSIQPVLLSCDDIDFQQTRGISNTFFGHLSYNCEKDDYTSFIGIGGSAEIGKAASCCDDKSNDCCVDDCKNCVSCALSQWSVWVKGGMTFN